MLIRNNVLIIFNNYQSLKSFSVNKTIPGLLYDYFTHLPSHTRGNRTSITHYLPFKNRITHNHSPYRMLTRSYSTSNQDNGDSSIPLINLDKVNTDILASFTENQLFLALVQRLCLHTAQNNVLLDNSVYSNACYTEAYTAYENIPLALRLIDINQLSTYYANKYLTKNL